MITTVIYHALHLFTILKIIIMREFEKISYENVSDPLSETVLKRIRYGALSDPLPDNAMQHIIGGRSYDVGPGVYCHCYVHEQYFTTIPCPYGSESDCTDNMTVAYPECDAPAPCFYLCK